jgi:hypothetical protein
MTDYREGLDHWLGAQRPCERMMVYDRNGVLLGRVKRVLAEEMIVAPPLFSFGEPAERRLDSGRCRVHGGAVHTSYSRDQLAEAT